MFFNLIIFVFFLFVANYFFKCTALPLRRLIVRSFTCWRRFCSFKQLYNSLKRRAEARGFAINLYKNFTWHATVMRWSMAPQSFYLHVSLCVFVCVALFTERIFLRVVITHTNAWSPLSFDY